jgi:hypothetical protein
VKLETVLTAQTAATGEYMLLEPDKDYPHEEYWVEPWDSDAEDTDSDELRQHYTRLRPCHTLFNELSTSIALAMSQMPKLRKLLYRTASICRGIGDGGPSDFSFSCYHNGDGDGMGTRIDWVFACNEAQMLGWRIPDEVLEMLKQRWGRGLDVAYITYEGLEARGWVRSTSEGQDEQSMVSQFFKDDNQDEDWG